MNNVLEEQGREDEQGIEEERGGDLIASQTMFWRTRGEGRSRGGRRREEEISCPPEEDSRVKRDERSG